MKFRTLMLQMEVLVNAWGLAGCFIPKLDTPGSSASSNKRLMCEWPDAVKYWRTVRDQVEPTLDKCTESSVCAYFIAVEEEFRQRALDHMREVPGSMFGDSFLWVIDKFNSVYYSHAQLLYTKTGNQNSSNNAVAAPPRAQVLASHSTPHTPTASGGRQGAGAGSPAASEKGKSATAHENEKGTSICKKYNDRRGCTWPCSRGKPTRATSCCRMEECAASPTLAMSMTANSMAILRSDHRDSTMKLLLQSTKLLTCRPEGKVS